jgi:formylglycine-generating enzyme
MTRTSPTAPFEPSLSCASVRRSAILGLGLLALAGCDSSSAALPPSESGSPAAGGPVAASASAELPAAEASASAAPSASAAKAAAAPSYPGRSDGCPIDMVRVEGDYCPALMQDCIEHHQEYDHAKGKRTTVSERCLRYAEPSRCVSKERRRMSYCMDRFEYPGTLGEKPRVLTSWRSAKKLCEERGKRLCTEDEFNFACEGPEMLPYVYGFVRDKNACNIDKPYIYPDHSRVLPEYDECLKDESCKKELERLDQREPIGQRTSCVSWAGVFDLNGNANEWVDLPGEKPPNRSGLKGGWWGPIRARCRPTVTFHKEADYGYEAGFRCCGDATP